MTNSKKAKQRWINRNRDKWLGYQRRYREKHKLKLQVQAKERYQSRIKEGMCGKCGRYPLSTKVHCEKCRSKNARRYKKQYRKYYAPQMKRYRISLKKEVIEAYGGAKCNCPGCGVTEIGFLTIDHIGNDGAAHRRQIGIKRGGGAFYRWLKKHNFPKGFQVLCWNCNSSKFTEGKCPRHGCAHEGEVSEKLLKKEEKNAKSKQGAPSADSGAGQDDQGKGPKSSDRGVPGMAPVEEVVDLLGGRGKLLPHHAEDRGDTGEVLQDQPGQGGKGETGDSE